MFATKFVTPRRKDRRPCKIYIKNDQHELSRFSHVRLSVTSPLVFEISIWNFSHVLFSTKSCSFLHIIASVKPKFFRDSFALVHAYYIQYMHCEYPYILIYIPYWPLWMILYEILKQLGDQESSLQGAML